MSGPKTPPPAGLCAHCMHARTVQGGKGETYILCGLSATDPSFPKYPRLPVMRCDGYEKDRGLRSES